MNNFLQYIRYRILELPIWLGIPFLGVFLGGKPEPLSRFILFTIAVSLAMGHVLFINDWGGLKRNPQEAKRYNLTGDDKSLQKHIFIAAIISISVSFLIGTYLLSFRTLCFFTFSGAFLSLLYSHPWSHWKKNLWGSKFLHFFGGLHQFLLGYVIFSAFCLRGILLGVFFSLIFTAGHFIHECIDKEEDEQNHIQTWATVKGVHQTFITGLNVFLFAHVYFLILTISEVIHWKLFLLFSIPIFIHIYYIMKWTKTPSIVRQQAVQFQRLYRGTYAFCVIIHVALIIP